MKKTLFLSLAGLALSSLAHAGSFQLNLQGIRQTAMGGAGVAMPWDASSIFFNPGALSRISGIQVYGSGYLVSPNIRFVPANMGNISYDNQKETSVPFSFYVGGTLRKMPKLGIGLGVYTPFGSNINWGNNWIGRYNDESISLRSVFFQPTVSYAINDRISVGVGFVYGVGTVKIKRAVPLQNTSGADGQATLEGDANGFGFNAGVHVKATGKLDLGISFRSGLNMKVDNGKTTFNVAPSLAGNFPTNNTFKTELKLPNIITVGAAYKATSKLTLQADVVFANWKRYDSLKFEFGQQTAAVQNSSEARNYSNTFAYRIGAHYKVNDQFAVMAGGAWDPTPSDDAYVSPDAVDADRIVLSAGLSYAPMPRLNILAALSYTTTPARTATYTPDNLAGQYQIRSLIPALGISCQF